MIVLSVLAGILALLWLLSLIRVGGWVEYSQAGVLLKVKVGPFFVQVFPQKPREKKNEQRKKTKNEPIKPKISLGGSVELLRELLPVVTEAAGAMKRRIRIDDLQIDLVWSDLDPARCAVGFGAANALIGMIWPPIEQNFRVKEYQIRTDVDFNAGKPTVYLFAQATLTIGQGVSLAVRMASRFLSVYYRLKSETAVFHQNHQIVQEKEAV